MTDLTLEQINARQRELEAEFQAEEAERLREYEAASDGGLGVTPGTVYRTVSRDLGRDEAPEDICDFVPPPGFIVKDSGQRESFVSGMVRDTEEGKADFTLVRRGPMYQRWAEHMTKGAEKYGRHNWTSANSVEELERFERSALRHFEQWLAGERDEDHAAAVMFNLNAAEYVRDQLEVTERIESTVRAPNIEAFGTIDPRRPWGPSAWEEDEDTRKLGGRL